MYVPDIIPEEDREEMIDDGTFGKQMGIEDNVAILVVDMTTEFVEEGYSVGYPETGRPAARAIRRLTDVVSDRDVPVYYSRSLKGTHPSERGRWGDTADITQTEEGTRVCDELAPREDDVVFEKYKPSVFFGTQLVGMLNFDDISTVIVTGMTTSGCVRATVVDAFSYNFRVVLPEECVADRSQISHQVSLFDIDMKYADVVPLDDVVAQLQ